MVQTRKSNLKSRSWRLEQPIRKKPYFETVVYGVLLGYRRIKDNGTWLVRVTKKDGTDWTKAFAKADDYDDADGSVILEYGDAHARARELARGGRPGASGTVASALDRYQDDLPNRGGATRSVPPAPLHLTPK